MEPDVFRAIADPTRRAVLDLLRQAERPVSEIAERFEMSQPAVSQHLKVLRDAGLVRVKSAGRERHYALDTRPLLKVDRWVRKIVTDPAGHVIRINRREEEE